MSNSDHFTDLSLILSQVLDDIGLNEECVLRQRRRNLLREDIAHLVSDLSDNRFRTYKFGSQTEVTTTRGLNSDTDVLIVIDIANAIQDYKDWIPGKINYLMISEETTYPGYCKLHALRLDVPLPETRTSLSEHFVRDEQGRSFLKHNIINSSISNAERNGPALTKTFSGDVDFVFAFYCKTWPKQFRRMSSFRTSGYWPTPAMVRYIQNSGCFVVPASPHLAIRQEDTWRISTSLAERCLMFSLNITQIRCYVLLKMIVKTFINPHVPDVISSYICKTLLFHCIERTHTDIWKKSNLVQCVNRVLVYMLAAVHHMECPNYFSESTNLFLGKFDLDKQKKLLKIVRTVLKSRGRYLLTIDIDEISTRLVRYVMNRELMNEMEMNEALRIETCASNWSELFGSIHISKNLDLDAKTVVREGHRLLNTTIEYARKGPLHAKASSLVFPFLCSYLASLKGNESILREEDISPTTLLLFKLSLDSDVTSSRLKYASYLYCTGQYQRAQSVVQHVEGRLSHSLMQVCPCHDRPFTLYNVMFAIRERRKYPTTKNVALCVTFTRAESQCCPKELQYEMFRSTKNERLHRELEHNLWMDIAAIDSLPYIFFLQYMTSTHLGQRNQRTRALLELTACARLNRYLNHRETVCNLLGQCMELENKLDMALLWYRRSLQERPRNNAAKFHITLLLHKVSYT